MAGDKAAKQCPAKGFKTLYAPSEAELKAAVAKWLGEATGTEAIG